MLRHISKNTRRVLLTLIVLGTFTIYLNIGWALGTYYHTHIIGQTPQTFWQAVWSGGYSIWTNADASGDLLYNQIAFASFWPIPVVAITGGSWLVYGVHQLGLLVFNLIYYLGWLVFGGGLAKLFGVG